MKIDIRELREGSNPVQFTLSTAQADEIVRDVDELYGAEGEVEVALDVQKFDALMQLSGSVRAPIRFDCARCLAVRHRALDVPIRWTLLPKAGLGGTAREGEEIELTEDDLDTSFYEGDEIDLGELAREAILLAIDPVPRCSPKEECAAPKVLVDADTASAGSAEDPRWAPLKKLLDKTKN